MLEDGARALLDEAVTTSRKMHPEVQLDTLTCMGHPVEVLAEQALTADMVVVGSRGGSGSRRRCWVRCPSACCTGLPARWSLSGGRPDPRHYRDHAASPAVMLCHPPSATHYR